MMVQLGQLVEIWDTARTVLGNGAGTQTAALAFGGFILIHLLQLQVIQMQQKNMMVLLGQ
jgi:hypothetical protein